MAKKPTTKTTKPVAPTEEFTVPTPTPTTTTTRTLPPITATPLDYVPIDAPIMATTKSTYKPPHPLERAVLAALWFAAAGFVVWVAWGAL